MPWRSFAATLMAIALILGSAWAAEEVAIIPIAHDLQNPRGLAVLPDGSLLLIEAGRGDDQPGSGPRSGQITRLTDANGDGDFDDLGERAPALTGVASYNSLSLIRTGHDEVFGLGDVALTPDGRIFYTKDDPFATLDRNRDAFYGNTGVFELIDGEEVLFIQRSATLNALVYDAPRTQWYITESGFNQVTAVTPAGEATVIAELPSLASGQQPVPSGIAIDPTTGDVLVALFSGFINDYQGTVLSFMPGDSKVVRIAPETGAMTDAITNLTTAIDVAVNENGDLFVTELTTDWPPPLMPLRFDLYDPAGPPDPGGYARDSGRVTLYPADGRAPRILIDRLDTPTSLTYADGALYVSTGLGTPGRSVHTPTGVRPIEGIVYRISGF